MRSSGLSPEFSLNDLKERVNKILIQFSDGLAFDEVANDIKKAKKAKIQPSICFLEKKNSFQVCSQSGQFLQGIPLAGQPDLCLTS